tara:strand:+ start:631 stop:930 length:300 start_codon:yes stop_codon:yes gene_type:complete
MNSELIEKLENIAVSRFKKDSNIGKFIESHQGEFSLGIVCQKDDEPYRVDLNWDGPPLDQDSLKRLRTTEGAQSKRIAYCEIDKVSFDSTVEKVDIPIA